MTDNAAPRILPIASKHSPDPADLHHDAAGDYTAWSEQVAAGGYLGFPWGAVDRIVGSLLPGWLVLVGGRAKGGKSTFLRATFDSWVRDFGRRILYVGTEQSAGILRGLWGCLRLGLPTEAAIDPKHPDHERVLLDVQWGQSGALAEQAMVVAEPALTMAKLVEWARYAWQQQCDVLMLDHFHRLEADPSEPWLKRAEAIREIKNIAVLGNLLIVCAAQLKNGPDHAFGEYEPPTASSWAETAGLRRECDVAIQVWRPFRLGVTREQKAAARDDAAKLADVVEANVMAVRCDAHRYRDTALTRSTRLYVHDGHITSWTGGMPR